MTSAQAAKSQFSLTALSSSLSHDHLGHLGAPILASLTKNKLIECYKINHFNLKFCHFFSLGKHGKLSFVDSHNTTYISFDILHSDVWTALVLSSLGHKYNVVFLYNYLNYL